MADWYEVPTTAVRAFERATGLSVCIHEVQGALWPFLSPSRRLHVTPACTAVRSRALDACVRFDVHQTRLALAREQGGRIQVCHAGLVEWVVPVIEHGRLLRVFFAGQRRPGPGLQAALSPEFQSPSPWAAQHEAVEPVEQDEALWLLEMLRQLVARFETWRRTPPQLEIPPAEAPSETSPPREQVHRALRENLNQRQTLIHHYIQQHHTKPITLADLAAVLHLSESRAGHAVTQACGRSFIELLTEARLRTAAGLLCHTNLSVQEVAQSSGFSNLSHFHRTFRKRTGTTPSRYRRASQEQATTPSQVLLQPTISR